MSCDVGEVTERLENELCYDYNYELCSFSNLSVTSPTSQVFLQPFCRFTYITTHSPTLLLLHLCQFILQPFFHFSYIATSSLNSYSSAHSPTFLSLHLSHNSFSKPSVALPTSQLFLQPFCCFTYVSSFSNPSFVSLTSQVLHLIHLASCP